MTRTEKRVTRKEKFFELLKIFEQATTALDYYFAESVGDEKQLIAEYDEAYKNLTEFVLGTWGKKSS